MNAHGEILLKPCPEIADAGNRLDFRIPTVTDSNWTLLNCWQEPTKRNSVFVSFILSRLVIIQARISAVQAQINALNASCCED